MLANVRNDYTAETNENTHTPEVKQRNDVESPMSSITEISRQNRQQLRNSPMKMKLEAHQFCASKTPRTVKPEPQKQITTSQLKSDGDDNISALTITIPLFEKHSGKVRHEQAVYGTVLHCSSWKMYVPLDFENHLVR